MEVLEQTQSVNPNVGYEAERYLQAYEDMATWLAESLDGSMQTSFDFHFDGNEILSDDGRVMRKIFDEAINDADEECATNPAFGFEARRRRIEREEYDQMVDMMKGDAPNTMIVVSDFPPELMKATEDVGGYNAKRKQTMVRIITKKPEGRLNITTQSLDKSDRESLEMIYRSFGLEPQSGELLGQRIQLNINAGEQDQLVDRIRQIYDSGMSAKFGGEWFAGIAGADKSNTYNFVKANEDILDELATRAVGNRLIESDLYNAAALIEKRKNQHGLTGHNKDGSLHEHASIGEQMDGAGQQARKEGKTYSGCGSSLSAENDDSTMESQLDILGFGTKLGEDKFGPRKFKCPQGHVNKRPWNKLISKCQHQNCKARVKC